MGVWDNNCFFKEPTKNLMNKIKNSMNKLSQFKILFVLHIDVFLSITFGSAKKKSPHTYIYVHWKNIARFYFYLLFERDGRLIFP